MKMKRFAAALLAACLLGSCGSDSPEPLVPVKEQNQSLSEPSEDWKEGMRTFSAVTSAKILSNTEQAKNALYSPASLYLALSATASITGGNTQAELLSLLEADSAENLGTEVSRWRRNIYSDQSENKVLIDGSIWMDDTLTAKQEALETLAEQYHTAAFQMDLNDPATAEQMAQWVREATGGLLGDPETLDLSGNVFSLISALYFYSKWENEFDPEDTEPGSFSAANGTDTDCEYMKISLEGQYAEQNGVKTAMLPFANGASLVFALPEEERLIRVYMDMKGTQLYISFTNFTADKKRLKSGKVFRTTKGEGHGFGLIRIDAIIERLDGYLSRNSEDGAFTTEILIPQV